MHLKINNAFSRVLASSVAVLLATTSLYAIPPHPCDEPAPPVCCEEPKPGPFGFAYPFDMDLTCPRDFYLSVSGLAFQAKQDGMDFVIQDSTNNAKINHGRLEGFAGNSHDWDWQPGVRVGMGFYLDHDAWNLDFNWTWVNITNYQHANATSTTGRVIPLWLLGYSTPGNQNGTRSSACWDADYNTIDVRLGKPYYVSRYLVFNPHFGVRGAWIDQHFSASYGGANDNGSTRAVHHGDNNFWGIGARCGIDTNWILGKGWKLFGNVASSILFGKFQIDQSLTIPDADTTNTDPGFDMRYDYFQNQPNLEIALGIGWGMYFNKKRNHISLNAAYEFHEWWDQLNMRKFYSGDTGWANDVVSRGNLTLNGFSLSLQFDI